MSWFSMDLECAACDHQWDDLVPRSEKDRGDFLCPVCNTHAGIRIPSVPNGMFRALPDGTKRFQKLREQDSLDSALSNMRPGDKDKLKVGIERDKLKDKKS